MNNPLPAPSDGASSSPSPPSAAPLPPPSPCRTCGACCACNAEWPRFSTESDAALDLIPLDLVDPSLSRMAWTGTRCAALTGDVGVATTCTIYDIRPDVCRACEPGDDACQIARAVHGLPPLPAAPADGPPELT